MNVFAIIPARGGSKRLPGKNLLPLAGKPLIAYTIEHAKQSKLVTRVIVSTDDDDIADTSRQCGAEVLMRPAALSEDQSSSESVLLHALHYYETMESVAPDVVVFLQCTSPLRNDDDIDRAIATFQKNDADSLFSAFRFNKFIWDVVDGRVRSINYDYNHRVREQECPVQFQENGSIYVLKPWILKKFNNRLGGKIAVHEMSYLNSFQIDEHDDIFLCESILQKRKGHAPLL